MTYHSSSSISSISLQGSVIQRKQLFQKSTMQPVDMQGTVSQMSSSSPDDTKYMLSADMKRSLETAAQVRIIESSIFAMHYDRRCNGIRIRRLRRCSRNESVFLDTRVVRQIMMTSRGSSTTKRVRCSYRNIPRQRWWGRHVCILRGGFSGAAC